MRKPTTLMITTALALLMLILGCSSGVKHTTTTKPPKATVTMKTEPKEKSSDKTAEAKKKSSSNSGSGKVVGYSTKSDYIVRISGQENPEIIQFLRRLENQCNCPDDLITQRIKPMKTTDNVSAFKLSLSPGMGEHIVFQVMVDDPNNSESKVYLSEQDWPSITAFDGTIDSLREVGVWRSGSYGGKGRGLFKIEELIVE